MMSLTVYLLVLVILMENAIKGLDCQYHRLGCRKDSQSVSKLPSYVKESENYVFSH